MSLLPLIDNKSIIDEKEIDYLKKSDIIYKNKDELFIKLENIEKNRLKDCIFCNTQFNKIIDLKTCIITMFF